MKKVYGNVNSVESMGLVDGPGIRFVVFMQGCFLRCAYCHNPETWNLNGTAEKYTPEKLVNKILRYKNYFGTDGGVTFSGGEPLLQPEFLIECLKLLKKNGIHTALDTSGVGYGDYNKILDLVDLVILDVKACDETAYKNLTGLEMTKFNKFVEVLNTKPCKVWIRQVIVPNLNDTKENIKNLKKFVKNIKNVKKIELLPYKTMGVHKYEELKIPYKLATVPEMDEEKLSKLEKYLK